MFAKFNLKMSDRELNAVDYASDGNIQRVASAREVKKKLDAYLLKDGSLDAEQIEDDWFPEIETEVFLSHSHIDERLAINLAGFLKKECGISTFIDSTVWGYADDLLRQINDKYCVKSGTDGKNYYDYSLRNRSAAQVYLLLQGALAKMINRCECLIFLNTPSSLKITDISDGNHTGSPWIYSELLMASTFPQRELILHRPIMHYATAEISFPVDLSQFIDLTLDDIKIAKKNAMATSTYNILNELYREKGIKKKE